MERHDWYLIVQFALKDFNIRYTHSVLGYAWSVVNPLLFSLIYYLVFSVFVRFDVPNYPGYLLLGIVLWSFFAEGRPTVWDASSPAPTSSPRWRCHDRWWSTRPS
jgi:ABC-type polysaccharide/polyol phosphate export permease